MSRQHLKFAKSLWQRMTDAEQRLWTQLRAHRLLDAKFKRQLPLGPYIVDFACFESWLTAQGYPVLRFWNNDVLNDLPSVLEVIAGHYIYAPSPQPLSPTPLPRGERG